MKFNKKNSKYFYILMVWGFIVGGLMWEVFEYILARSGVDLNYSIGPVGFDLDVISFYIKVNPGSFLGLVGSIFLFKGI